MSVFNLDVLETAVVVGHSAAMLLFPFLSDLLLLNHDRVGALLVGLVPLLDFKQLVLQVSHLDVALVIQLINTAVEHNLEPVQLGNCRFFFVPQLVDEFTKTLVVVEVAFVVAHVGVKLDFLLVLEYRRLLPLVFDGFQLLL